MEKAVVRELQEELNVKIKILGYFTLKGGDFMARAFYGSKISNNMTKTPEGFLVPCVIMYLLHVQDGMSI